MDITHIQTHLSNRIDAAARAHHLAGIVGDRPSQYAKSPSLWNAAFRALDMDAVFVPFDVDQDRLAALVGALRESDRLLGFSVTVPYKIRIIDLLDEVDEKARQIGAVNTVARSGDGRLVGFNTDGSGFLASVAAPRPGTQEPLIGRLEGLRVLLIGAGGAARAVAFYLAESLGRGELAIANRSRSSAERLAADINQAYGNARVVDEDDLDEICTAADLVVNCSTKGQSGLRRLSDGGVVLMEPYSALAPARPARVVNDGASPADTVRSAFEGSLDDIEANRKRSVRLALRIPHATVAYDLVYDPFETVFLRHCRWTGHRCANGKAMNIGQAVDAFFDRVCGGHLAAQGRHTPDTRQLIEAAMTRVW